MVPLLGASFLVVVAIVLLLALKAPARIQQVLVVSHESMAHVRNKDLSDDEKEKLMQQSSLRMFGLFFVIMAIFAVAFLAPTAVLWGLDKAGVLSLQAVLDFAISIPFLVGTTVVGTAVWLVVRALRKKA
jgi:hypothetical protein